MSNPFLGLGFNSWSQKFSRGIPAATLAFLEYLTIPAVSTITIKSTTIFTDGSQNYEVDWGDGSTETSTADNLTHNYSSAGQYTIKISPAEGTTYRPYFNGSGFGTSDDDKLLEVDGDTSKSGTFPIFMWYAWQGSSTLTTFNSSGNLDFSNVTSLYRTWSYCTALSSFGAIDTSSVSYFGNAWQNCTSLTTFPLIDTSSGTTFDAMFQSCINLTALPAFDFSSGTSFFSTFFGCSSITSLPQFDVSSGTNLNSFCNGCTNLADVPALTFNSSLQYASNAFNGCALSAQSIENILVGWDNCGASNVSTSIGGGTSAAYSTWSSAAQTALSNLQGKGWTITYNT